MAREAGEGVIARARMPGALVVLGAVLATLAGTPSRARAHGLEPALLTLREKAPGVFDVRWKSSKLRLPGANVAPRLPRRCRPTAPTQAVDEGTRVELRSTIDCGVASLAGETVGIDGLEVARITALLLIERSDGTTLERVLNARAPAVVVPAEPDRLATLRSYLWRGAEHILTGPEHLLLVLGLLLLVPTTRRRVQVIAAFTLGHSVTLAAAALGLATPPAPAIGLLMAASVLVLAVELARADATVLGRLPWLAALAFGLVHGLGFAGTLAAAGLPPHDVPGTLLAFNLGIELGQLAFVLAALGAAELVRRLARGRVTARARLGAVYAMGILGAFWCLEGVALWLG